MENLLKFITRFCDDSIRKGRVEPCGNCSHPVSCSGDCNDCIDEVHFPDYYKVGKKDYDCFKMLCYYVCRFSYRYCSEIEHALNELDSLKNYSKFNILSVGSGCSPDLMAFDSYRKLNCLDVPINYLGLDNNNIWSYINKYARLYRKNNNIIARYEYADAIEYLLKTKVGDVNIVTIQYLISHLFVTGQYDQISLLYDGLINSVIKNQKEYLTIIFNDVNKENYRYYLDSFFDRLKEEGVAFKEIRRYFKFKPYGQVYLNKKSLHEIPARNKNKYKTSANCSSMQLIIDIKGCD